MRRNRALYAALALAAVFFFAVTQLVNLAFRRAPVYADYSTMRSDPVGAKALYETLAAVPGVRVERHVRRAGRLAGVEATVFWLGEQPGAVMSWSKQDLAAFEAMTSKGGRVVIGIVPTGPIYLVTPAESKKKTPAPQEKADEKKPGKKLSARISEPEIEKLWRLKVERDVAKKYSESDDDARRQTSVWLKPLGEEWRCAAEKNGRCLTVERPFGKGTVVIAADTFPLSNEGLRDARRAPWIAELVGPWKRVIFDEAHLGVEQTGSVGTLIRQFRLEAAALMLVTLAALFIWRNSSSFLPLRPPAPDTALSGDPHRSLTLLLRRAVPAASLAQTCLDEWKRAKPLLPYRQAIRVDNAAAAVAAGPNSVEAWRRVRQAIQERK